MSDLAHDAVETILVGQGALAALPILLVDGLAAGWLLRIAWRADGRRSLSASGALDLGLFFGALALLALAQFLTHALVDGKWAFGLLHAGQSIAVIATAVPLVRFAHRLVGRTFVRESRVSEALIAVVAVVGSVPYFVESVRDGPRVFDVVIECTRLPLDDEWPWSLFLTAFLLGSYGYALVVLWRKSMRTQGAAQRLVRTFALIVLAAIGGVVINRVEALDLIPAGTYTTTMLWVTLAAVLLFLVATDEVTQFRDRIAALVVVALLGSVSVAVLGGTHALDEPRLEREAVLHAMAGEGTRGRVTVRALVDGEDPPRFTGEGIADGRITTIAATGSARYAVTTSYLEHRRVVHVYASRAAWLVVFSMILALFVSPRLAEWSVLGPLARFVRAESESRQKSVFLASMSHELRTPLTAISHHASVLRDGRVDDDETRSRARDIEGAARHLLGLIESLLLVGSGDASRQTALREAFPVDDLVHRLRAEHAHVARTKGLALTFRADSALGETITTDARLLQQIASNLVGNALKFTDAGEVTVSFSRGAHDALVVTITDTGRGIPERARARIFEPFFQHDPKDGVGLGLALVRTLTDALGGTLAIESAVDRGTRVSVTIPEACAPVAEGARARVDDATSLATLSAAARRELTELAQAGDIVGLRARVRALADEGSDPAVIDLLDRFLERYQIRAVRELLEQARVTQG